MHVPLEHTHYIANNQIFKQIHQQTAVFYKIWTLGSSCSRKIKDLSVKLMAWQGKKKQKNKNNYKQKKWQVFSHNPLWNGSESSLWSSSSRLVISLCPGQQPPNYLPCFSAQLCSPFSSPQPCPWSPSSQPASPSHPSTQQAPSPLVFSTSIHLEDECGEEGGDNKKRNIFVSKVSYCVLAGWAMGQRAVRPKLQRQYIMPLESDQLSEIGS